jgi:hypothetical protein
MNANYYYAAFSRYRRSVVGTALSLAFLVLTLLAIPATSQAQSTIVGYLSNFDAVNNTGQDIHGLEIQLEGLQPGDIYYTFGANRYGTPKVVPYATGVYLRWQSPVDPATQLFTQRTIPHPPNTPFGGTCYQWYPATYDTAGCEHFGVTLRANATATTYRWLVADPVNLGVLLPFDPAVAIPGPVWVIGPAVAPAAPPVVIAEINAPEAVNPQGQFGNAQWVKVFKTELPREVGLDELVGDNPVVPQAPAQIETAWKLIQSSPPTSRKQKGKLTNGGATSGSSHAVIRRYEFYAYTGIYDPLTHEAICGGDGLCNAPLDGELGDAIGAQMGAANLNTPSITVSTVGNGGVASSDKLISCGNKCAAAYTLGAVVILTEKPGSGSVFSGWSGACTGVQSTCTVSVNDALAVTATFTTAPAAGGGGGGGGGAGGGTATAAFTLSIGRSNPGTVTGTPAGNDRSLNCGSACSAKFNQGTAVTLTAAPPAGKLFVGWGGACSGTDLTCTVTMTKDTSVQANFAK